MNSCRHCLEHGIKGTGDDLGERWRSGEQDDRGFRDIACVKTRPWPIQPPPRGHSHVCTWIARVLPFIDAMSGMESVLCLLCTASSEIERRHRHRHLSTFTFPTYHIRACQGTLAAPRAMQCIESESQRDLNEIATRLRAGDHPSSITSLQLARDLRDGARLEPGPPGAPRMPAGKELSTCSALTEAPDLQPQSASRQPQAKVKD